MARAGTRGAFILFEGVDRCGKSTQTRLLLERLREGGSVADMRFPDRTTGIGQMINGYLTNAAEMDDRAIHLLFSANRWELCGQLQAHLEAGTTVVCDRYAYSGVAFSAAKPGLDLEWCMNPDRGLPRPDVVIFLDLPLEDAEARGQYGEERYEKRGMQRLVHANYQRLRELEPDNWRVVDARGSIEEVAARVAAAADEALAAVAAGGELQRLWV